MPLEVLVGVALASVGIVFFALATLECLRLYQMSDSPVWFFAAGAAGLSMGSAMFFVAYQLAPNLAILSMVLALLVQLSAFALASMWLARRHVMGGHGA